MFKYFFKKRDSEESNTPNPIITDIQSEQVPRPITPPSIIICPAVRPSKLRLVLDVDGTIISIAPSGYGPVRVYLRPGVIELFQWANYNNVKLGLFTAADNSWFHFVHTQLLSLIPFGHNFEFIYTRVHCDFDNYSVRKQLRKVWDYQKGWTEQNTVIVDDTPNTFFSNIRNGIHIKRFYGDPNDRSIFGLIEYLDFIKHADDCRYSGQGAKYIG